jgi:hypothetical protein
MAELGTENQNFNRKPTPTVINRCSTTDNRESATDNHERWRWPTIINLYIRQLSHNCQKPWKRTTYDDDRHSTKETRQPTVCNQYSFRTVDCGNKQQTTVNNQYPFQTADQEQTPNDCQQPTCTCMHAGKFLEYLLAKAFLQCLCMKINIFGFIASEKSTWPLSVVGGGSNQYIFQLARSEKGFLKTYERPLISKEATV